MTRHYGYNLKPFIGAFILWALLLSFVIHENWGSFGSMLFYFYMFIVSFCISLATVTRVTLTDEEIVISKLIPFSKQRRIPLDSITAYNHEKSVFSKKYAVGKITPKEGKQILIRAQGTQQFSELDSFLSERFPSLPLPS